MPHNMHIPEDAVLRLLASSHHVPKPICQIARSGEGGDHVVWIIDDALVLRVPADAQDDTNFIRERALWRVLQSTEPDSAITPTCIEIGKLEGGRPYGLYRKLAGVSIEASPQSVNDATEKDLASLLLLLKKTPVEHVRAIGVVDAAPVDLISLRWRALTAWRRLVDNGHMKDWAPDVDIDQALQIPEAAANAKHAPVLLHADLKGEHIFIDPATGRLTGVVDWSDACLGHPASDLHGLAVSVGAAAAARIGAAAGYDGAVAARGAWMARCEAIVCLDAILYEGDDSPEWLVRRQLRRALERVGGLGQLR